MLYIAFLAVSLLLFIVYLVRFLIISKRGSSKDLTHEMLPLNIITMLVIIISALTQWMDRRESVNQFGEFEERQAQRIVDEFQIGKISNKEIFEKYSGGDFGINDGYRRNRLDVAHVYALCGFPTFYSREMTLTCNDLKTKIEDLNHFVSRYRVTSEARRKEKPATELLNKIQITGKEMFTLYQGIEDHVEDLHKQ